MASQQSSAIHLFIYRWVSLYTQTLLPSAFSRTTRPPQSSVITVQLRIVVEPPVIKHVPLTFGFPKTGWKFSQVAKTKVRKNPGVCPFREIPSERLWKHEITTIYLNLSLPAPPDPFLCVSQAGIWDPGELISWQEQGNIRVFQKEKIKY